MSSYKTDNKSELPILYLQDNKKSLQEKFTELYPNDMERTFFMTYLESSRFVYKENLEGLCSICNENFYDVFSDLEKLIENNITNMQLQANITFFNLQYYLFQIVVSNDNIEKKNDLCKQLQILQRYLRKRIKN